MKSKLLDFGGLPLWCMTGKDGRAAAAAISSGAAKGVFISRARGFQGGDLSVLEDVASLEMVVVEDLEDADVSAIQNLSGLRYLSIGSATGPVDISKLRHLEHLRLRLGAFRCLPDLSELSLHSLALWQLNCADLGFIASQTEITLLEIYESRSLRSLNGLENSFVLNVLKVGYCSNLVDLSALVGLRRLSELDLNNTKSLTEFHVLESLPNLRRVTIDKAGGFPSLDIISRLPSLEHFSITRTKIYSVSVPDRPDNLTYFNIDDRGRFDKSKLKRLYE